MPHLRGHFTVIVERQVFDFFRSQKLAHSVYFGAFVAKYQSLLILLDYLGQLLHVIILYLQVLNLQVFRDSVSLFAFDDLYLREPILQCFLNLLR